MEIIDFKKAYKPLYSPKPGVPEIVFMPRLQFAMVDGQGDPNTSQEFRDAVGALYGTVFGLKFARKRQHESPDYTVGVLEGLWWSGAGKLFDSSKKEDWLWTLMIWLPDVITCQEFSDAVRQAKAKKPNPALERLRLRYFEEGMVVQIMHIGPYSEEQPSIERMHAFANEQGYQPKGKHHEIYLGDPRRANPAKLRTILRHPIEKKRPSTAL